MYEFTDIVLINNEDTPITAEQKKQMNMSKEIILEKKYPEGLDCICGKNIKIMFKHINSSKHKRFCDKHGINIKIKTPPPKPVKKPKEKRPLGRPRTIPLDESDEDRKKRISKYAMTFLDKEPDRRTKHNQRVAKFREANRELCRQRVRDCRRRKKERELAEKN